MLDIARAEGTAYASSDEAGNNRIDNYTLGEKAYIWMELVDTDGVHINDQDLPFGIRFGEITLGSEGFNRQEGTYSVYQYSSPGTNPNSITPTFTAGVYTDTERTEANALIAEFTLPVLAGETPQASGNALPHINRALVEHIDAYQPEDWRRTPDDTFTSISALQSKNDSKTDHQILGRPAVYQLAGGTCHSQRYAETSLKPLAFPIVKCFRMVILSVMLRPH